MSDEEQHFELHRDDEFVIDLATTLARRLVRDPSITPYQIVGLRRALEALEHLPESTNGVNVTFGVSIHGGGEDYEEMSYISFAVYEDEISLSRGGSVYDKSVGSDSYSLPGWRVALFRPRQAELDVFELQSLIHEYMNGGPEISVEDESSIEHL